MNPARGRKSARPLAEDRGGEGLSTYQTSSQPVAAWESAYLRFQTREREVRKHLRRLRRLGVHRWPRNACVLDLFCGSGAGLVALERLGFADVIGVDRSARLLATYTGRFPCFEADGRDLAPLASGSLDLVIIQGGLHHLERLHEDLPRVLGEVWRVLGEAGTLALLEPWGSPFLSLAHAVAASPWARRASRAVDAFGTMVDEEGETYRAWLANPGFILDTMDKWFETTWSTVRWGKRMSLGLRRRR